MFCSGGSVQWVLGHFQWKQLPVAAGNDVNESAQCSKVNTMSWKTLKRSTDLRGDAESTTFTLHSHNINYCSFNMDVFIMQLKLCTCSLTCTGLDLIKNVMYINENEQGQCSVWHYIKFYCKYVIQLHLIEDALVALYQCCIIPRCQGLAFSELIRFKCWVCHPTC